MIKLPLKISKIVIFFCITQDILSSGASETPKQYASLNNYSNLLNMLNSNLYTHFGNAVRKCTFTDNDVEGFMAFREMSNNIKNNPYFLVLKTKKFFTLKPIFIENIEKFLTKSINENVDHTSEYTEEQIKILFVSDFENIGDAITKYISHADKAISTLRTNHDITRKLYEIKLLHLIKALETIGKYSVCLNNITNASIKTCATKHLQNISDKLFAHVYFNLAKREYYRVLFTKRIEVPRLKISIELKDLKNNAYFKELFGKSTESLKFNFKRFEQFFSFLLKKQDKKIQYEVKHTIGQITFLNTWKELCENYSKEKLKF